MRQYGQVAVRAARALQGSSMDSRDAWKQAARAVIRSESSRDKGCPRGAFLGLAYTGAIEGVTGAYADDGGKNGLYARKAWKELVSSPGLASDPQGLWERVRSGGPVNQNGQLDVTLALWKAGLLRRDP